MKIFASLILTACMISPAGFAQESIQVTDFYEKRDDLVNELLKENRSIEDVLASIENLNEKLILEIKKKKIARSTEITLATIGAVGIAVGAYMKKFGEVPIFKLNVAGKQLMIFSGLLTGASVIGGETYISLRRKDMQELSMRIDADIEILKSEHDVNARVADALRKK